MVIVSCHAILQGDANLVMGRWITFSHSWPALQNPPTQSVWGWKNDFVGGWLCRRHCRRFWTCDNTRIMQISPLSRVTATLRGSCDFHKLDYDYKETAKPQDALKRRGLTWNFPQLQTSKKYNSLRSISNHLITASKVWKCRYAFKVILCL